jgi:predicted secreted hydrolase
MPLKCVHFPTTSYQQTFAPGMPTAKLLAPAEDGSHQPLDDKFFEWWYFDAHFDNDYRLVVAFHTALFSAVSRPAVITLHLYGPGGWKAVEAATFKPSATRSAADRCDVQLGASRAWDAGGRYIVRLAQGRIRAELEYHSEVAGIQAGTGMLFHDSASRRSFHWVIPLPRARVSGWLWIDEKRMAVQGIGYHDHNWGNLDLDQPFRRWVWGRAVADEYTLVFGNLIGRGEESPSLTPLVLWQGTELLLSTDQLKPHSAERQVEGQKGLSYPHTIELQIDNGPQNIHAALQTEQILDIIDFAQPRSYWKSIRRIAETLYVLAERAPRWGQWVKRAINHGTYLRLQATCQLAITNQGHIARRYGHALYEMMDFGVSITTRS